MTPDQLAKSGSEHSQQRALFAWANMAQYRGIKIANSNEAWNSLNTQEQRDYWTKQAELNNDYLPQLKWLHAIHNQGHGDAIRGSIAKAEGVKSGVWDIFLPVVMGRKAEYEQTPITYAGLYIEMKVGKNRLTDEQVEFGDFISSQGYKKFVAYSWQEARDAILKYLGASC